MGSPCELVCECVKRGDASELSQLAAEEAWRIEDKFSRYTGGSAVARINEANGEAITVDDETADLLDFAATLFELSDARFDITSGVLRHIWSFDGGTKIPRQADIETVRQNIGWSRVAWHRPELQMPKGMEIDLGGIGKEYAVDRAAKRLREEGAPPCLVNFGGDLATTAAPRVRRSWRVGIEGKTPDAPERRIDLRQGALATSGDARRFLEKDGVRYGHILDPLTGWPVPDAPRSVTVAAESCTQAGMISTLAMLKGAEAEGFLEAQNVRWWCYR